MGEDETGQSRRRSPWGVLALVMLTGLAMVRNGVNIDDGPPQPTAASAVAVTADQLPANPPTPPADMELLEHSSVQRIRIPTISVDAPVMTVGLDAEGWIDAPPPQDRNLAGWYLNGISPGQRGSAVIVGHVDNAQGPAVFYGLGSVKPGNHIEVERYDGRTAVFEVYGVEVFSKEAFPGARVYGDTGHAELRVITCGGGYSKARGYDGNVVVFARMVEAR
ncbi:MULTISPECIES: class F sortase [Streptomyces]|uniref:Class F sortase n=2 Tax=Streptomyces virginiae TaxID=1961 RepID=A0ABQ3NQK3_STRVG|nr:MULTISPECIES: class F sortase [Streptomyces]KOU09986.1 peptidase C60 [Streptomyces sp. WM6349]KOU82581.1 peptidase C60 [Streptomyces sp. XY593]KOU93102.1 peptidase C60 [Streptomyces sp. XY533]KOV01430.1 peptidase C60 [Streptomyces sp. XY511]KOV39512.1 peptidase C60 [Streptomyces sp. H036]